MPDSIKKVMITFDGGAIPNPGEGYGSYNIRIDGNDKPTYHELKKIYGSDWTNNQSEYNAVIRACKCVKKRLGTKVNVKIYGDSKIVINQALGTWIVREEKLKPLHKELMDLLESFKGFHLEYRPGIKSKEEFGH